MQSAKAMARAAPPDPRSRTRAPSGRPAADLRAASAPDASVLYPVRMPPSDTIVFTAPIFLAVGSITSRYGITATLCGMVTLAPRMLVNARRPRTAPSRSSTLKARYTKFKPACWKAAL